MTKYLILFLLAQISFAQNKPLLINKVAEDFYVFTTFNSYKGQQVPANGMYVVGDENVFMIDSPWDATQFQPLLDSIYQKHHKPVKYCIATHSHSDRTNGLEFYQKLGIKTYTSAQTDSISRINHEPLAEFTFKKDTVFQIGKYTLQVFYPGKGHAEDNIVVWCEQNKLLFGGCFIKSVDAEDLGNLNDADVVEWPYAIKKVRSHFKNPKIIIPGHGDWTSTQSLNHTAKLLSSYSADYIKRFDELLVQKQPRSFNGTVLIVKNGKTIYSKGNLNDRYLILSITKQMTAALVLLEAEKSHLKLSDPISKYLPETKSVWGDSIKISNLLNHTSGILESKNEHLKFKPGTQFLYSNLGYDLLAKIIEKTSKKSFHNLANALFSKCKMNDTYLGRFPKKPFLNGNMEKSNGEFVEIKGIVNDCGDASGGVVSTANDLIKWNKALHHNLILKPENYKKMANYSIMRNHPVFGRVGYGFGIMVKDKGRTIEYGHTGYLDKQGFTSINLYFPKSQTQCIILENKAYLESNFDRATYFEKQMRKILLESDLVK